MTQVVSNKWLRGLNLNANPYIYTQGKDPYGGTSNATVIADEAILTRERMIGNRRGFQYVTNPTPQPVDAMFEYQQTLVQHESDGSLWHTDPVSLTRTQYSGSYPAPANHTVDAAVGRGSLFFTTANGVRKLPAASASSATLAGLTKALDLRGGVATGTGTGFLTGYSKVAYRVTWRRGPDANNQTIRSDVSTAFIVTNASRQTLTSLTSAAGTATATTPLAHGFTTGDLILMSGATQGAYNGTVTVTVTGSTTFTYPVSGAPASPATTTTFLAAEKYANATINFTVPFDVQTGDYWELWRTVQKDAGSPDPGDEMYLVVATLNATAAGGVVTYSDSLIDTLLIANAALYTNATQETATQGNARPPNCTCLCDYKGYMIYGNTRIETQTTLTMLATINFVANTSSITINDNTGTRVYVGRAAENVSTQSWQIYTGGLSVGSNIEQSCRSICHVINGDPSGRWYAEYTSGATDTPGAVRIFARTAASGDFWVTANNTTTGNQFNPVVPASGSAVTSSADPRINRIYYSKIQQPEAVPTANYIDVGRLDQAILRVVSIRDACFVISEGGIWYLSGQEAPFSVIELDTTCHCVAEATVRMLNNTLYFLSNQGVVSVSLSGVTVISIDIEPRIMFSALPLPNLGTVAFAVGNEAARHYMLWLPSSAADTVGTQAYVYHTFIKEWVRWLKPVRCGVTMASNYTLYISSGLEKAVLKQRNQNDVSDFSDEELPVTISAVAAKSATIVWPAGPFVPKVGMSLHQAGSIAKVLTVTGTGPYTLALDRTTTFTVAAATVRMPISSHIRLSPNVLGESGLVKTIYGVSFLLEAATTTVTQASIEIATNEAPQIISYPIVRSVSGGWGSSWGTLGWGDVVSDVQVIPWEVDSPIPDITGEAVTAGWIHSVSQEQYVLAQVSVPFDQLAEYEVVR